mmetsp:Transcript_52244/g.128185  ORF Transcript_52244/g.128185 Transcript_52244/m.128185 type:complete len:149 (-) Transcript_52244:121-567(-)
MGKDDDLVRIGVDPLSVVEATDFVSSPKAGGISTFIGTTRDTFEGKNVVRLEYEAYESMAIAELESLCSAVRSKWEVMRIAVFHRLGVVPVSEASVIIAVSSAHRKDCIDACHFAIDELKARVPIWKKEVYEDGSNWKQNAEFKVPGR